MYQAVEYKLSIVASHSSTFGRHFDPARAGRRRNLLIVKLHEIPQSYLLRNDDKQLERTSE